LSGLKIRASCRSFAISGPPWAALERDTIREMRWWSVAEISASTEHIFPAGLAEWLPDILAGNYPAVVRMIE
jgi:hypothetical protein